MNVLEAKNLTKEFGRVAAIKGISFSLREGEILGLLGPNGAGKTTTIQMLLGVLTPTAGKVEYFGKEFHAHRQEILEQVNFSSTYTNLPWELSVRENLTFISYLYDISDRRARVDKILELFQLKEMEHKITEGLSAGQLTRLNLAKAFINFPRVLLLDEPTASLDPEVAKYIREFLLEERQKFNVSIIITSHNMAEVEEVCDRVVFINKGNIIADDTPENLSRKITTSHVKMLIQDGLKRAVDFCKNNKFNCQIKGRYLLIDMEEEKLTGFLKNLEEQGISYDEISIDRPTLEDYFLSVAARKG